ncbi:ATP-binding protein [Candidatus Gracilibacteria bacterium]|nr:ATP-binding protein [Candidatus Gracilibacteria bacterium]
MYKRILEEKIKNDFFSGKIIMLLGARQIGKTTLVEEILKKNYHENDIVFFNGDYNDDRELLSENSLKKLGLYIEDKKIIFIDEAQKIQNIGNTLKIIFDKYKDQKQLIVTGSSSINLLDLTSEPLTGRKIVYMMYPISIGEIKNTYDVKDIYSSLENLLIFGSYPAVLNKTNITDKIKTLKELSSSSLYRDILEFQQIKNSYVIMKLLKLLALQIGKEVSINELATNLGVDTKTVDRYIDLLEKSFIIFRLPPYFTNKRKELNKSNKIYFYDLGIRNSILGDYNFLENRNDIGELWENFLITERIKKNEYAEKYLSKYFWRTYNQSEIDYIEEYDGKLHAYEFKWGNKLVKVPKSFIEAYPDSSFEVINKDNFLDFVL